MHDMDFIDFYIFAIENCAIAKFVLYVTSTYFFKVTYSKANNSETVSKLKIYIVAFMDFYICN